VNMEKGGRMLTRTASWRYLFQEAALILLLGYALLLGGTYNGLVLANLRLVTTFVLALVSGGWLGVRLLRGWPFPHTSLDGPLMGYLAVHVITATLSSDPRRSVIYVWLLAMYILLFYLFVDLLRHGWPAELFVKAMLAVSAIVLGFGLRELALWYGAWHDIWGWAQPLPALTTRVHAFLGHPNWVAAFLNLLWPLTLLRLFGTRARLPRVLLIAWLLAALVLLYFTSSRGGWLGTATAGGVAVLLAGGWPDRLRRLKEWLMARRWRAVGLGGIALGAGLALGILLIRQLHHPSHGGLLESRRGFWQAAWIAFSSKPLWGTGPFTYGETFLRTHSVPPESVYGVAHNYVFNLASESGLLGLAALAWLTLALGRGLWQVWQRCPFGQRGLMIGVLAALGGCAVHSWFDSIETVPTICIMLALLLGLCFSNEAPRPVRRHAYAWTLPLGWVLLLSTVVWSLWAYRPFSQGVLAANLGRWSEAAPLLDLAAQRDPYLACYHLQAGYVHGVRAAAGDPGELAAAIAYYQAGIARSPHYALNAANLGALYQQAGELDQALQWMQRAAEQAPGSALFALNLGRLYEELGQVEQASHYYRTALDHAPEWSEAFFWRSTPLRATIKNAWLEARPRPAPVPVPRSADEWLVVGSGALSAGRNDEALSAFQSAARLNPHHTAAYLGQANAYMALGRNADAERALRTALLAEGGTRLDHVLVQFALGRLYHEQGNTDKAIAFYEAALDTVRHFSVYGPGSWGASDYAWYLFYSETIQEDLLPQLTRIQITDDLAQKYFELGQWYEEQGNTTKALDTYDELLTAVPDFVPAIERRQALAQGQ